VADEGSQRNAISEENVGFHQVFVDTEELIE